jgi:integrase
VKLTDISLKALKTPGRHKDDKTAGLYVQVTIGKHGDVNRSWLLRYTIAGRTREMGLGGYPAVGLKSARDKAADAMLRIKAGRDPLAVKTIAPATSKTFRECADEFLTHLCKQKANTKFPIGSARSWRSTLDCFAMPKIGNLECRDIKHAHIAAILTAVGDRYSTASKLRARLERILDYAAAHGVRDPDAPNPASLRLLKDIIGGKPLTRHHAAPALADAPLLYQRIAAAEGSLFRCLEFVILTASRVSEIIQARWADVDLAAGTITIPAVNAKMSRDHVIPLSGRARQILDIQAARRMSDVIFPSAFGSPFERTSVTRGLARLGIAGTLHGWRSTFRDCAADEIHAENEIAEFALGHVKSGVEGAYRRQTALARRAALMEEWARWLAGATPISNVIPLRATAP